MFYDSLLGTGGLYSQSFYLSCMNCLSVHRWSRTGETALWQNLVAALDLSVLPMCHAAKGCSGPLLIGEFFLNRKSPSLCHIPKFKMDSTIFHSLSDYLGSQYTFVGGSCFSINFYVHLRPDSLLVSIFF
jgi:hypothetical protein